MAQRTWNFFVEKGPLPHYTRCVIVDPSAFLAETHPTLSLIGCLYWLGCLG